MKKVRIVRSGYFAILCSCAMLVGCEPIEKPTVSNSANSPMSSAQLSENSSNQPKAPIDLVKRRQQFAQMQDSMHAVATIPTARTGPESDFKFVMPSDDWVKVSHGGGDRKASVWLFSSKKSEAKILISCAGVKEDPTFAGSAQRVYDSSVKKNPELTREWKFGNFTLKRSFIGFIDDRHGEVTVTAFSPICTVEFNIGSETMDRDDLFKFSDNAIEEFIKKNPKGGFPFK